MNRQQYLEAQVYPAQRETRALLGAVVAVIIVLLGAAVMYLVINPTLY
jgi:hypothetical protein